MLNDLLPLPAEFEISFEVAWDYWRFGADTDCNGCGLTALHLGPLMIWFEWRAW